MQPTASNIYVKPHLFDLYTDAGITLVPCAGYGKAFASAGLMETAYDPHLKTKNCNYRALLRNEFLVVDVDPRHFQSGDSPFKRLCKACGLDASEVKDTFTVQTPSGGFHFYFKKPKDKRCRQNLKEYPGLDFLSLHATAAGSYNPDVGKNYEILHKSPMDIRPIPDAILGLLAYEEMREVLPSDVLMDLPANISRFTDFVSNCHPAVAGQNGDNQTYKTALIGRDMGISSSKCHELMLKYFNPRCVPPWDPDKLKEKIAHAYDYGRKPVGNSSINVEFQDVPVTDSPKTKILIQLDGKDNPKLNLANTITMLSSYDKSLLRNKLRFNQLSHQIEFIEPPPWYKAGNCWSDNDAIQAKAHLSINKNWDVSINTVHEAAVFIAAQNSYHPVRDYILTLKWDGTPRLNNWLAQYCKCKAGEYASFIGRKSLVGAIARVFSPGCKFDHVLVLVGSQGTGKSLLCRTLGSPWFTDSPLDIRNYKQAVEIIQGNWIIELAEMDILNKSETRALKGFISTQIDRFRPAYGRITENFNRQCIFIGTINPEAEGFLKDPTGNRRWWPIEVGQIDIDGIRSMRDQLWAEAYNYYLRGELIHVDDETFRSLAAREASRFEQEDPWYALIKRWLEIHEHQYFNIEAKRFELYVHDVYGMGLGGNQAMLKMVEAVRIAAILKRLGYHKSAGRISDSIYFKNLADVI